MFRFRGNRPGEAMDTPIDELALIGDRYLYLEVTLRLFHKRLSNSQITVACSTFMSNAAFKEEAIRMGLVEPENATHASGTLLEALVGYWHLSSRSPKGHEFVYLPYKECMEQFLDELVARCLTRTANNSLDDLFE